MLLTLGIACFAFTASRFGVGEDSNVQTILLRKETQRERGLRNENFLSSFFWFYFLEKYEIMNCFLVSGCPSNEQKDFRFPFFVVCLRSMKAWTEKWRKIAIPTWAPFTSVILNLFVSLAFGKHLHQSFRKKNVSSSLWSVSEARRHEQRNEGR